MGNIGYEPPTPEEFRELLERFGVTDTQAGELVGVNDRQIRRYKNGNTPVPYAVIYALMHKMTGEKVEQTNWRGQTWLPVGVEWRRL